MDSISLDKPIHVKPERHSVVRTASLNHRSLTSSGVVRFLASQTDLFMQFLTLYDTVIYKHGQNGVETLTIVLPQGVVSIGGMA